MADQPTADEQLQQLKKDAELLKQQLDNLKAEAALASARQASDSLSAKIALDAQRDQIASQSSLGQAQAQLPFAELQGIKAGLTGLTLPKGNEGTVKVSAGVAGASLLRSKRPMLILLDKVATKLAEMCPPGTGAALVTEAQLAQASAAEFMLARVRVQTDKLTEAEQAARPILTPVGDEATAGTRDLEPAGSRGLVPGVLPSAVAGAYALGFTLDTINSLAKLLRTNRQIDVFSADAEAVQLLGYLLESKSKDKVQFVANPAMLGTKAIAEAESLLEKLQDLGGQVRAANETLAKIKTYTDALAQPAPNDLAGTVQMPAEADVSVLKAEVDRATSLLDGLDPAKKSDMFWAQVSGQVIAANIEGKMRLLIDAKAQAVQVTESRWYTSDRILSTGEVQVSYRLLNPDGSLERSGVMLKGSKADSSRIDQLEAFTWP